MYHIFLELTCPGHCNNAGICNTSTGQCLCNVGIHGSDCSSKFFLNNIQEQIENTFICHLLLVQNFTVLVMELAQVRVFVTMQEVLAFVMMDLREILVKVAFDISNSSWVKKSLNNYFFQTYHVLGIAILALVMEFVIQQLVNVHAMKVIKVLIAPVRIYWCCVKFVLFHIQKEAVNSKKVWC